MSRRATISYIWFACLVLGSFLPYPWKIRLRTHGPLHLPLHFVVFAISGWVACGRIACANVRPLTRRILRAESVIALAAVLEVAQAYVYGNRLEWKDIVTDAAGVLAAVLIGAVTGARWKGFLGDVPQPACQGEDVPP